MIELKLKKDYFRKPYKDLTFQEKIDELKYNKCGARRQKLFITDGNHLIRKEAYHKGYGMVKNSIGSHDKELRYLAYNYFKERFLLTERDCKLYEEAEIKYLL